MKLVSGASFIFIFILSSSSLWAAGNAASGKKNYVTCVACHGANGMGIAPTFPNLAGQKAIYTVKQLKAFKSGTRVDPIMKAQVAKFSDQDFEDLAAYIETLK